MRKLFSLFAALTLSVGLWAETVNYLYPVYNTDGDVTSGIKEWKTGSADATEITNASGKVTWGTAGTTTWFVVNGTNVQLAKGAICAGDVRLILADNAQLTAQGESSSSTGYAGIQVSGEGNSLTIYAQSTGTQKGQLIAYGGYHGAGIGGSEYGDGSNITINGGIVTATGDIMGAGIGGGDYGPGSNITINGGEVEATGGIMAAGIGGGTFGSSENIFINGGTVKATGEGAAGIGGGEEGSAVNIFVTTSLQVKADNNNPPTTVITNTGADLASSLAGKQYVTAKYDVLQETKTAAIAAVNAEIAESDNDNVKAIATSAATAIKAATTEAEIYALKNLAIANIASAKAAYTAGEEAVRAALPTEGTSGPAITITKGDKTVTFYNTDKVEYSIVDAD